MSLALFIVVGALTVIGALGVVTTRNIVYAALFLLMSLMGVAGIYLLVFAEFLALVQILIYGGAITIVVIFAIMLTRTREYPRISDNPLGLRAAAAATALGGVIIAAFVTKPAKVALPQPGFTFAELGQALFTTWALPFEIASLVLLVALLGAIIIARVGGGNGTTGVPPADTQRSAVRDRGLRSPSEEERSPHTHVH